jgi:hypothetical protein
VGNIYEFLLSVGAPPETIQRLMSQMQGGKPVFDSRSVGMKGSPSAMSPISSRPQGAYSTPNPPRL